MRHTSHCPLILAALIMATGSFGLRFVKGAHGTPPALFSGRARKYFHARWASR